MAQPVRKIEFSPAFAELLKPHRYKAFHGGRGGGKSHHFAAALVLAAAQRPTKVLCAREVQQSMQESVHALLAAKIKEFGIPGFEILQNEIRAANGSQFFFRGLSKTTADGLKSFEGAHYCWIEEAQTISENSLEIILPTIRYEDESFKSEVWFSWNPRHPTDPVDKMFRGEHVPKNAFVRRVNYDDNLFFPNVLEDERRRTFEADQERYAHIWLGEYEPTVKGAIWDRASIASYRRSDAPPLDRIVVGVDPAVSSEDGANEHGIVVCGMGEDERGYVLEDATLSGNPHRWATRVLAMYDKWEADAIVIEVNQGGDMVRNTIDGVRPGASIIEVRATRGKHVRAEPIAAQYSLGNISHIGTFPQLEDQLCQITAAGYEGQGSPDRADAMVWAFTELLPGITQAPIAPRRPMSHTASPQGWMM